MSTSEAAFRLVGSPASPEQNFTDGTGKCTVHFQWPCSDQTSKTKVFLRTGLLTKKKKKKKKPTRPHLFLTSGSFPFEKVHVWPLLTPSSPFQAMLRRIFRPSARMSGRHYGVTSASSLSLSSCRTLPPPPPPPHR